VDDTLLMHDISEYPEDKRVTVSCNGREFVGVPNQKNINLLIKFYKLGYDVYVWSKTGESWAQAVGRELGLDRYVNAYLTKPDFYMDDKGMDAWMGPRVYRNALTGAEQ
jgi:hypothetical protein